MKKMKILPLLAILSLFLTLPAQAAGQRSVPRCQTLPRYWIVWRNAVNGYNPFSDSRFPFAPSSDNSGTPAEDGGNAPVAEDNGDTPVRDNNDTPAHNGDTPVRDNGDTPVRDNGDTPVPTDSGAPVTDGNPSPDVPADSAADSGLSAYESEVVRLVNEIRVQYGLNALTADAELSRVARYKSQDMVEKGYFSHTSPTYGSPFDMMKAFGISYRSAGENIAYGYATPQAVVDGWMNSSGHRANILNSSYTRIGVGYVAQGHYWTQMFIG